MHNRYFTFLYNECKRKSNTNIDSSEITRFINSPEGERGYKAFCAMQNQPQAQPRPKSAKDLLSGFEHE